jgi:hypothetical protein
MKKKATGVKLNSWVILFDLHKAFDVIPRTCIWKSMEKMGVAFKMIQDSSREVHI